MYRTIKINNNLKLNMKLLILSGTILILSSCNQSIIDRDKIMSAIEEAYFEGQKDALNGNIRIKKNNDGCWIWTKSCWNNGRQPIFNPSIVCGDEK